MDFTTTARLLMKIQAEHPGLHYRFEDGILKMELWVDEDVPALFGQGRLMFAPVE